jgi:hypothetical protein
MNLHLLEKLLLNRSTQRILESPLFLLYVYEKDRKKPTPSSIKALEELACKDFFTCTIGHDKL